MKRIALVVGNGTYEHASALSAPRGDALAMRNLLTRLGFDCVDGYDCNFQQFREKRRDFLDRIDQDTLALLYFSGHGVSGLDGENHLVPVDAGIADPEDIGRVTVGLNAILDDMRRKAHISLVLLDACRDNPFRNAGIGEGTKRVVVPKSGLAAVPKLSQALVAFAAAPGEVALDEAAGKRSPFTAALLKHLGKPGREIRGVLTDVRADVVEATDQKQWPWNNDGLLKDLILTPLSSGTSTIPNGTDGRPGAPVDPYVAIGGQQDENSDSWTADRVSTPSDSNNSTTSKQPSEWRDHIGNILGVFARTHASLRRLGRYSAILVSVIVFGVLINDLLRSDLCRFRIFQELPFCAVEPDFPTVSEAVRPLLSLVAKAESGGNYNAVVGAANNVDDPPLTSMTIGEVLDWQNRRIEDGRLSAVGAYQITREHLQIFTDLLELSGREIFDAALQDRIALEYLNSRGLRDFLAFRLAVDGMGENLARSWASLPVLVPTRNFRGKDLLPGQSWYAHDSSGKVSTSVAEVRTALSAARRVNYFAENPGQLQSTFPIKFQFAGYVRADAEKMRDALVRAGWKVGAADRDGRADGRAEVRSSPDGNDVVAQLLADDLAALTDRTIKMVSSANVPLNEMQIWIGQ